MKKMLPIALVFVLSSSMILVAVPIKAAQTIFPDYAPVDWRSGLAGEVPMPKLGLADHAEDSASIMPQLTPPLGSRVWDWYLNSLSFTYRGVRYPYMTLRAISGNAEVWVAQDEDLMYLPGDPRNANPRDWNVTDAMCQYIANEYNNVIYPTDTQYFGVPANRDGTNNYFQYVWPTRPELWSWISTDNPQRVIIKIFNIVDSNFFDPNYSSYVGGFFSPDYSSNDYYDRNMIHVDNWRYWQRLGEREHIWYPDEPNKNVTRPYLYESTIAHEFQHNIHSDWNPADDTFMNEGCSMYAELICGYEIEANYVNNYFATPDDSLTLWGDQGDINILADYGESALWTIYLSDHYGGSNTIRYFVQNGIAGIDGINSALAHFGYKERFEDVFHDWRLANLIHQDFQGCKKYNYKSLNLSDPVYNAIRQYKIGGLPVPQTMGTDFGNTITMYGDDTGVSEVGPYGTDYVRFENWSRPGFIYFDGDDYADVPGWTMTAEGWYSGAGIDLQDASIVGSATVTTADPTLTIVTKYGIESYWDFGFVQVSTDGNTWTSLANAYTTSDHDPSAHPAIIANLPGLTDYNPDWDVWTTMSFDLTAYAGKNVMMRFRYMTDWATTLEGWWINSATVSGTPLSLTPVPYKASYQVTIVQAIVVCGKTLYVPLDMKLSETTEKGIGVSIANKPCYVVLVVSPTMHRGTVDYTFQATTKPVFIFCNP